MSPPNAPAHCRDAYGAPRQEQAVQVLAVRQISWLRGAIFFIAGRFATGAPDGPIYSWKMFSDTTFAAAALALHSCLEVVFRHNLHRPVVHHRMRPCHREELVEPPHAQASAPNESPECPCSLQGCLRCPAPRTSCASTGGAPDLMAPWRDPVSQKIGDWNSLEDVFRHSLHRWGPVGFTYSWKMFSDTTLTVSSPMTGCAHATARN